MRRRFGGCLSVAGLLGHAFAAPYADHLVSMPISGLFRRDVDDFDFDDLSFIKKIAAVGDSYSAGIGSGSLLARDYHEFNCRRYDHSYPWILNEDPRLGDPAGRNFQFASCSGAVTQDVIDKQIPELDGGQQVILLSAGGNDLELTDVLNQCIFQLFSYTAAPEILGKIASLKGESWAIGIDFEKYGRGCDLQIQVTKDIVESPKFSQQLDATIKAAQSKLAPDGMIYYAGYARFFSEDKGFAFLRDPVYLDYFLRMKLNDLVNRANQKIREAVERAGPGVTFVDYDHLVERYHGRFCEVGVDETTKESNHRPDLMFWKLDLLDPFGANPWKRSDESYLNGTFAGDMNMFAKITETLEPSIRLNHAEMIQDGDAAEIKALMANFTDAKEALDFFEWPNLLPDGYGRVFHPQVLLHELIANLILFEITNRRLEQQGLAKDPEFLEPPDSCPLPNDGNPGGDDGQPGAEKPFYLRIMPLGASITAGVGTKPQNGYRKPLRDQLRWEGWPVNMIGSGSDGDPDKFKDRQHEGHPGWVVANMTKAAAMSIDMKPNLILINCGTNDASPGNKQDVSTTGARMEGLLNYLYDQVDGVTIILSTLLQYLDDIPNQNVNAINIQYRQLYQKFRNAGKKIGLAELNNGLLDTSTDYFDHIHPNEKGAAKLAAVWDRAIAEVAKAGFLTRPIDTGVPDNITSGCDAEKGQGRGPVRTQQGSGQDDGAYSHDQRVWLDAIAANGFIPVGSKVSFAQLVNLGGADPGGELDELIYCHDEGTVDDPEPGHCFMILNNQGELNGKEIEIDIGLKCITRGHRWGDVNGDGLDDFICIGPDGNMYVSINRGGNPPKFEPLENGGLIKEGYSWARQDRIRLGDIDGDGRLDYCAIDDKGDIYCWRNGGVGDAPTAAHNGYWQSFVVGEPTFRAQHETEGIGGVNLVDINGDGRSDWVYLHNDASSTIFINQRGDDDADGKALRPHWQKASSGHIAIPLFEVDNSRTELVFGRVKGSGRADLIWNREGPGDHIGDLPRISPWLYENLGSGGTKLKGDGVFYCDMFGRGRDDYLWVKSDGHITLYENILSPPNWGQHGEIVFINRNRKSIHFGDWDGDGLCDILAVERHTGRVEWWRNTYKEGDKSPSFDGPKWAVNQGKCDLGWGRGLYDQALRFGDLDGDGRVDYLCMEKDARTVGYLNKPGGLVSKGQIKFAPQGPLDRANFKWADVNGDGLVDLIWVDKFSAKARVWKNGGFTPAGAAA
ncbi:hypothetical protein TrVFT333_002311 [Trichoderma virens FT-333]|nr:hypothetical protein TrVFT333_002311 [Trichoderma virens FT-333]